MLSLPCSSSCSAVSGVFTPLPTEAGRVTVSHLVPCQGRTRHPTNEHVGPTEAFSWHLVLFLDFAAAFFIFTRVDRWKR